MAIAKNRFRYTSLIRWVLLGAILIGVAVLQYLHLSEGVRYPSVHAVCPLGGLENLWAWLAGQANVQKIFSGTMTLFFFTLAFSFVFRRTFCGNVCPFGALQELLGRIFPRKLKVPRRVDKYLLLIKYALLLLSVIMAWATVSLWIAPYDPWAAFAHLANVAEAWREYSVGLILLGLVVLAALFANRPFCRYLCPAGALYALAGKFSPLKPVRDPATCVNCEKCSQECPMDIEVHTQVQVKSMECIACARCVDVCPKPGTMIAMRMAGVKVPPLAVVMVSVALFFGGLMALDATGLYRVVVPSAAEIVEERQYILFSDLRGSMTIEAGAFYTGKDLADFYRIMEIPEQVPKQTPLKEVVMYVPGYDFHAIKANR